VQLHARRSINGVRVLVSHFPYAGDHTDEARYDQWRLPDYDLPIIHGHTHSSDILSYSPRGTPQINVAWEATKGLVTFDSLQRYLT
jgi:calcineurin-like phosphoesterase family protein